MKKVLYLLFTALFFLVVPSVSASTLPQGFEKTTVASGFAGPTDFIFTPDGRILIAEKGGTIKVIQNGTTSTLLSLPVSTNTEQGLLGITIDPAFSANGYIYVYYTNSNPLQNRVSRFTVSGNSASLSSEKILLHSDQPLGPVHHAGTVAIGPDKKLWISVGNNFQVGYEGNSQDLSNIHGKILRINTDGTIPSDNPFVGQTGRKGEIWAYGFRNPFRFSFVGSKPIVGDVGEGTWEEINIVEKGGNYGWPLQEGACSGCPYINPYYAYRHPTTPPKDSSVTGGFVYKKPATGGFPAQYDGSYFYGDYAANGYAGFIHRIIRDEAGNFVSDEQIDAAAGNIVSLKQGADGAIYYIDIVAGKLIKLSYTTGNIPPEVKLSMDTNAGMAPVTVHFSSEGSYDPEGTTLTYLWNFGDGTTSTEANPTHVYTQNGIYTAALTVNDGTASSSTISTPITVGATPPTVSFTTPSANMKYVAGQTIQYAASAVDTKDGDISATQFSWTVIFHHGTHTHPFLGPIEATKSGSFVIPPTGEPSADTYYEIVVAVKNSQNLTSTKKVFIYPTVVKLTIDSLPDPGLSITLDGIPHTTPYSVDSVVGFQHSIDVLSPQNVNGSTYDFSFWSQGGNKSHIITTSSIDTSYTANFNKTGSGLGHLHFRVREFDNSGNWTGKFINGITAKLTDITGSTVYTTETSQTIGGQDGWVYFDYQPAGTYGVITYSAGYTGYWKQTNCDTEGTTDNATIKNTNTSGYTGAFQSPVGIASNQITWCKDVGIKRADKGNLYFRIRLLENDPADPPYTNYVVAGNLNGATVKLTDTAGQTVIQTLTSAPDPNGNDGWALFKNIPAGTYGIMAYKPGYKGVWKQIGCVSYASTNASITNGTTEGNTAAWNNTVEVPGGLITYCRDLGLVGYGHIHYRVREFDSNGNWTGKFINGAKAKLTDVATGTVVAETVSKTINGQDGWVYFDYKEGGTYTSLTYLSGYEGYWKQTDCDTGGTTTNVTIQNTTTENVVATTQTGLHVEDSVIVWCKDVGLKKIATPSGKGHVHLRIREFDGNGNWTGKFINGATAKLTDSKGSIVYSTASSQVINGQEGWVYFDFIPSGTYSVLVYTSEYTGYWRQTDCNTGGSTTDTTISNTNTEGITAAFQKDITISKDQVTWCKDVGLKNLLASGGRIGLRIREVDSNGAWNNIFINTVTVKLTDVSGQTVYMTQTSAVKNNEDGWVFFDNVPVGTYGILAYSPSYTGMWKQTDCDTGGSTTDTTISNTNTEGLTAAWRNDVGVSATTTTWCKDVGLKKTIQSQAIIHTPIPTHTQTPTPTPTPTQAPTPVPTLSIASDSAKIVGQE